MSADPEEMIRIAEAADELEGWLQDNAGHNADWPVRIDTDEDSGVELASRLENLRIALKPYRGLVKT